MGQTPSRDVGDDSGIAERGCRRVLPCFRLAAATEETSLPDARNGGLIRNTSDMFRSCEDLGAVAQDVNNPERRVLEMEVTLRALRQLNLPPGADEACDRVAEDLKQLQAVLAGGSPCSSTTNSAVGTASETEGGKHSAKDKLHKVVHAIQNQQELSLQPGSLASALNSMISILWPRIDTFVEDLVHTSIEPSINASLPGLLKASTGGVKFSKVSLGDASPLLGPIFVEHDKENGAIAMHVGIDFKSALDVELTAMGIPIGITEFFLKGELVLLFTPPMLKPPFFGGVQVYFPNPPDIGLNFAGAARVADCPGLRGAVRGAIDGAVAGVCVLPRRIAVDMNEEDDVDIIDLTHPEPIGILRFTLWSGENLVASDTNLFGTATSDPYVVASMGIKNWTSPHVSKTLSPEWGEGAGLTVDFPVHDDCQQLILKVFDYDFGSADDLIGMVKTADVRRLVAAGAKKQKVELLTADGVAGGGSLTISATLFTFSTVCPRAPLSPVGPSDAHLSAKVLSIKGLQEGSEYPFKVRVRVVRSQEELQVATAKKGGSFDTPTPKRASAKLKASKSMALGTSAASDVIVEGITAASHPQEQKQLSETLQGIAKGLCEKGLDAEEIAELLDVGPKQVEHYMKTLDPDKAKEYQQAQLEFINVRQPLFEEVVQLLLPCGSCDSLASLELGILDKRQKVLATARVTMPNLLDAPSLRMQGPFATDVEGVEVVGDLQLRWLV